MKDPCTPIINKMRYPLGFDGKFSPLNYCCHLEEAPKSSCKKLGLLGWSSLCDLRAPVCLKTKGMPAPKHAPSR